MSCTAPKGDTTVLSCVTEKTRNVASLANKETHMYTHMHGCPRQEFESAPVLKRESVFVKVEKEFEGCSFYIYIYFRGII